MIVIKILSIDQATVKTGIAIHNDNKLDVYDLINLKDEDEDRRVESMMLKICECIKKNKPDFVVIEDIALQRNPATLIMLARLQGAIIGYCVFNCIPYDIMKPPNWRKVLGFKQGRGIQRSQLKKQAIEYVHDKYGLTLQDDICESICIGDAYLISAETEERSNK